MLKEPVFLGSLKVGRRKCTFSIKLACAVESSEELSISRGLKTVRSAGGVNLNFVNLEPNARSSLSTKCLNSLAVIQMVCELKCVES